MVYILKQSHSTESERVVCKGKKYEVLKIDIFHLSYRNRQLDAYFHESWEIKKIFINLIIIGVF